PIVFLTGEDPARLGLVASLARPGSNLTGINFFNRELVGKQLGFLRELVLSANRIAVLVNPTSTVVTETTLRDAEFAARAKELKIQIVHAGTSREIDAAFAAFERDRPGALFVAADPFFNSRRLQLSLLAMQPRGTSDLLGPRVC
ncbi:MAG: ABC transporter substrate binding protein, partial [Pseudolabrys sp.]